MKIRRASSATVVAGFAATLCLSALMAGSAQARQTMPSGAPPPGQRDPFAEVRERQQREAQLRSAERLGGVRPTDRRSAEAGAQQMSEDFKRIQILRNNVVRHLQSDKPLDYKFIAAETEEINRRAARLKAHLVREGPEGEKKEPEKQAEIGDAQITDALVKMCRRIDSFTENPVFNLPDVVDVEQSVKAGRDLLDVIRLSGSVNKLAERLSQTTQKK
ncbi:MAG: hypothetical protein LC802_08325 [Acidobacteria bacterium]|nr:hypothetical protein [Acidobacteriota bacterium]